ncbi:MAG TPA: patatin-like phospholipase family protein [Phycisphaerae bacterium]|jgi:predicted acylesterase/phospholipase RssA
MAKDKKGRVLRLGFAMGGGVSLGSFQGAALSQAIKLAIAYATYNDSVTGKPVAYQRVEIDVFSGSSAGAMSLAIMLSTLRGRLTPAAINLATANLAADPQIPPAVFANLSADSQSDLIAAQAMQDAQADVWQTRLGIESLVGKPPKAPARPLTNAASLLDRGALEKIAQDLLVGDGSLIDTSNKPRLLASRVLFACTLTNLTPIILDARADIPDDPYSYVALRDGLRSKVHRELRVFDLHYTDMNAIPVNPNRPPEAIFPDRWCRYVDAPPDTLPAGATPPFLIRGSLRSPDTWKTIGATALACGAFPFAFEPVPLTRYQEEFGDSWPTALQGKNEFVFSYIDGGTFNNEPIREAFRLASYVDSLTPNCDFDRRIIYCTPFASPEEVSYGLPYQQRVNFPTHNPLLGPQTLEPKIRATLDRLVPHVGTILGALVDEGRNQEDNKIFFMRNRFKERDQMRAFLSISLGPPSNQAFDQLISYCTVTLAQDQRNSMIPPTPLGLVSELQRVIWEWQFDQHISDSQATDYANHAQDFNDAPDKSAFADASFWLLMLSFVALDNVLDLNGKSRDSKLIAIGPFTNLQLNDIKDAAGHTINDPLTNAPAQWASADPIDLDAGQLFAFAGFMSASAMATAFTAGKQCALDFLTRAPLISPPGGIVPAPVVSTGDFRKEIASRIPCFADRVAELIQTTQLFTLPAFDDTAKGFIAGNIRNTVMQMASAPTGPGGAQYEMRIYLPSDKFRLSGGSAGDVDPLMVPVADGITGRLSLITFGKYDQAAQPPWYLANIFASGTALNINTPGFIDLQSFDSAFCTCDMPDIPPALAALGLSGYPIWSLELTDNDRFQHVPSSRWKIDPAAIPLEKSLGT